MYLKVIRAPWAQTAAWHLFAILLVFLFRIGQTFFATGILLLAVTLTGFRILSLVAKRRSKFRSLMQHRLRRKRLSLTRRLAAFRRRLIYRTRTGVIMARRKLLPHRISYGIAIILVAFSALPQGVAFAAIAAGTLAILPISLRLAEAVVRHSRPQSVLLELMPSEYAKAWPPEPFYQAPRVGPDVAKWALSRATTTQPITSMSIIRILGNDLPPRHSDGQTVRNLEFLLQHESNFPGSHKAIILNRIIDTEQRDLLAQIAHAGGLEVHEIPFDANEYRQQPLDFDCLPHRKFLESKTFETLPRNLQISALNAVYRFKNCYAINNNGARNVAIDLGLAQAEWVLPLDGNVFVPVNGWSSLVSGITTVPTVKYWVLPMRRITQNQNIYQKRRPWGVWEEPQVAFSRLSSERFREDLPYGRRPKVDLLWKIGVPGPWQRLAQLPWDQPYPERSRDFSDYGFAGEVLRLNSGKKALELGWKRTSVASKRNIARDEARLTYIVSLEERFGIRDDTQEFLTQLSTAVLDSTTSPETQGASVRAR